MHAGEQQILNPVFRRSKDSLLRGDDLAAATVRGYPYDLRQFLRWFSQAKGSSSHHEKLSI
jgi:hypothetical protein